MQTRGYQVTEALRAQMEVQRRLHKQLEVSFRTWRSKQTTLENEPNGHNLCSMGRCNEDSSLG